MFVYGIDAVCIYLSQKLHVSWSLAGNFPPLVKDVNFHLWKISSPQSLYASLISKLFYALTVLPPAAISNRLDCLTPPDFHYMSTLTVCAVKILK